MKNFDQSEAIDLESDLNPTYFRQLSTLGKRASFEAGSHIFYQGEDAGYVFLLTDGLNRPEFVGDHQLK